MPKKIILVTGGAGFIGSNIVEALLENSNVTNVLVMDNLSTGFEKNIQPFYHHPRFRFINADIRDFQSCLDACTDVDAVCHQAALGSVPRSIEMPATTHQVNVDGFFNMLEAARQKGIKRFVYASSSSVYGDAVDSPKTEDKLGAPLSPYAVTKRINEFYANVFCRTYGMEVIGLRYFNVFGPRQDPNGAYAAVIPIFFKAALSDRSPTINGDGSITRDFTYIDNVVDINIKALFSNDPHVFGKAYNVGSGHTSTLNEIWKTIKEITNCKAEATHGPQRPGDILHSLADITRAKIYLDYHPTIHVSGGLKKSLEWYIGL